MDHGKPQAEEIEIAFSKLQSNVYFDNYDLILRKRVAVYKKDINNKLRVFAAEFNKAKPFANAFKKIRLITLPKKIKLQRGLPDNFYSRWSKRSASSSK